MNSLLPEFRGVRRGAPAVAVGRRPSPGADVALWEKPPRLSFCVAHDSELSEVLPRPLSSVATSEVGGQEYSLL